MPPSVSKTLNGEKRTDWIGLFACIIAGKDRKGKGKMSKRQWRDLIVRAIEDAIIIFLGIVAIWALAFMVSNGLSWLGVL